MESLAPAAALRGVMLQTFQRFGVVLALVFRGAVEAAGGPPATQPYYVHVWQTEDGLPGNAVPAVAQTHDGYLWVCTYDGLARFDGVRFTVFDDINTPGLRNTH